MLKKRPVAARGIDGGIKMYYIRADRVFIQATEGVIVEVIQFASDRVHPGDRRPLAIKPPERVAPCTPAQNDEFERLSLRLTICPQVDSKHGGELCERELHGDSISHCAQHRNNGTDSAQHS